MATCGSFTFAYFIVGLLLKKQKTSQAFTDLERRSVMALSSIYALRMFGLFLILPVLSVYADSLSNATPLLIGMALGAYGFTQAVLQIPFGLLSDRMGRKRVITAGLALFVLGSLVAAVAHDIVWVIIGRALQGSGAIAAVVLALTADLTRENQRSKAMALIGMSIGMAFMLALVLAPIFAGVVGVQGLFVLTAVLAVLAMIVLWRWVPSPAQRPNREVQAVPSDIFRLLADPQLIRLDVGIFVLHFVLTAMFVVVPLLLVKEMGVATSKHWQVYLPALLASVAAMVPLVMLSAQKKRTMRVFFAAICILLASQVLFLWKPVSNVYSLGMMLFVFFWGFNTLEAMLPSLVTRLSPAATKGTAVGVYNTFQFAGVFAGGALGGLVYGQFGYTAVFVLCGLLLVLWALLVQTAPATSLYDSRIVQLTDLMKQNQSSSESRDATIEQLYQQLKSIVGVKDVTIIEDECLAYLKVDKDYFDEEQLAGFERSV